MSDEEPVEEYAPHLRGDRYDGPFLLTYRQVADVLGVPNPKDVYNLPLRRVRVSEGRVRWRSDDVKDFIERRSEEEP